MRVTSMEEMFSEIRGKHGQIFIPTDEGFTFATIIEDNADYTIFLQERSGKKYKFLKAYPSMNIEPFEEKME